MATDLVRTNKVRIGIHSSVTDFTSVPATLKFHDLKAPVTFDPDYNYEDRSDYQSCANEPLSRLKLNQKVDGFPDMTFELKGLDIAVSTGVSASAADFPLAEIFESCFSGIINGDGYAGDPVPSAGSTLTITSATSGSNRASALLIETLSGRKLVREIGNASGFTYGLDRSLLDAAGAPETAAANANIWGSRTFISNNQVPNRKHLYIDTENLTFRRTINGVMGTLTIKFPNNNLGEVMLQGLKATGWTAPSPASPACVTSSAGNNVPSFNSIITIDTTEYRVQDVEVSLNMELIASESQSSNSGVLGYVVSRTKPIIKFKIPMGTSTLPAEATDAFYLDTKENNTYDILAQFGSTAQECVAFRAPSASIMSKRVNSSGIYYMECSAECSVATESGTTFGTDPLRFHIF